MVKKNQKNFEQYEVKNKENYEHGKIWHNLVQRKTEAVQIYSIGHSLTNITLLQAKQYKPTWKIKFLQMWAKTLNVHVLLIFLLI